MSNASRLSQLQDRLGSRESRLQINEIVDAPIVPEYDSVGLELRAHRERKGHDIEMAGRVLRIKTKHLLAIEESRFDALPGKTYAIGFVRAYAEHLGLDPDDCIRRYKLEYAAALEPAEEDGAPAATSKLAFPEVRDEVRLPHGSIIILAGLLVLGVWGGWYLTTSAERAFSETEAVSLPPADLPTPEDAEAILHAAQGVAVGREATSQDAVAAETVADAAEIQTNDSGAIATATEEPGGVADAGLEVQAPTTHAEQLVAALTGTGQEATATETETEIEDGAEVVGDTQVAPVEINAAPAPQSAVISGPRESQVFGVENHNSRVILRARGATWVRVEDPNGAVLFEKTLQRGDSYRVPNLAGLILATRNAGAIEILLDGESLGPAGAVGEAQLETSLDAGALGALGTPASP